MLGGTALRRKGGVDGVAQHRHSGPIAPCARARCGVVLGCRGERQAHRGTFRACVEHRWLRRGLAVAVGRPSRHLQRRSAFGARSRPCG